MVVSTDETLHVVDLNTGKPPVFAFSDQAILFYLKPLLGKWLKTFPEALIYVVSEQEIQLAQWQKRFPKASIVWMNWTQLETTAPPCDLLVSLDPHHSWTTQTHVLTQVRKGGAFFAVVAHPKDHWVKFETALGQADLVDLYRLGFHPFGAVPGWRWQTGPMLLLGRLLRELSVFFPGHYELGLLMGQYWLLRALKRDDYTPLG